MSRPLDRLIFPSPSRRRAVALALAGLALAAALPFAIAQAPNPSGPDAPPAVVRYFEFPWGTELRAYDPVRAGGTYDLTATNLSGNFTAGEGFTLHAPGGAPFAGPRAAYDNPAEPGTLNVTFPALTLFYAGNYTLNASGFRPTSLHVPTTHDLFVNASPNPVREGGNVTVVIEVLLDGAPVANATLAAGFLPPDARTGADGRYAYAGPAPAAGKHPIHAALDRGATAQPEHAGATVLVVEAGATRPTLNVTASPSPIPVDASAVVTVRAFDAINGTPYAGHPVRLCGAPLGGDEQPPAFVNGSTPGCTGTATTNASGMASLGVHPKATGRIHVYVDDQSTKAYVEVVAPAARPLLVAGNASAAHGEVGTVPISIRDVEDLGALTFVVRYDTRSLEFAGVTASAPGAFNTTWHVNQSRGEVTFLLTTAQTPGPGGWFNVSHLHLRAIGAVGETTPVKLNVTEAAHSDGTTFALAVQDGTFRAGTVGDADGDGDVDLDDVRAITEVVVGARSGTDLSFRDADVNRDGAITGVDAMMVRQFVAGTRPTLG